MSKQKLTLYVDYDLTEPMKMLALVEKRSLSELTESLYREYLGKNQGFIKSMARGKRKLQDTERG
jgi:hypothetical protein